MKAKSLQDLQAMRKHLADQERIAREEAAARAAAKKKADAERDLFQRAAGKVEPLRHHGRVHHAPDPVAPGWEIGEDVDAADAGTANAQALEALQYGAEGLTFYLAAPPAGDFLDRLTAGIHRDYIGLHFAGPGLAQNPGAVLAWLERSGAPSGQAGSLAYDPAAGPGIHDWRYLADLLQYLRQHAGDAMGAHYDKVLAYRERYGIE